MKSFLMTTAMTPMIFRQAEGEGAGGGSDVGAQDGSPAPDKISALEARLERITGAIDGMTNQSKQQKAFEAIAGRDRELAAAKKEAEDAVSAAEKRLAEAYDNGEGIEIAKAQRLLSESVAKVERRDADLTNFREQVKAAERKQPQGDGGEKDATNLNSWKDRNAAWYGVDAEMTRVSHEIHRQIKDAGVHSVGSKQYFEAIDRAMSQRYPDKFSGTPPTTTTTGGSQMQNTSSKGRIQKSIADGYRRMGINIDDPKVAERMLKNRELAVQKGILPSQPVQGSIVTR